MTDPGNGKQSNSNGHSATEQQLLPQAPSSVEAELRLNGIVRRRLTERSGPVEAGRGIAAVGTRQDAATTVHRRDGSTTIRRQDAASTRQQRAEDAFLGYLCPSAQAAEIVQNFARLCIAGHPAREALAHSASDARPEVRRVFQDAAARVAEGTPISAALAAHSNSLPPLLVPALRAWELHGQQDADLTTLAHELRRLGALEQRDTFLQVKGSMQRSAERIRQAAKSGSTTRSMANINASRGGIANRSRATMRWNDLFVSLWRCGVSISEALEVSGEACGNGHYRDALSLAAQRTREGLPLSECLAETRLLPIGLIDRLRTGEASGRLDETLEEFARVMEGDAKELGGQHLFMRRILPAILLVSAVMVYAVTMAVSHGVDPRTCAIGALIFLPVAFLVWEFVFKQTVHGGPDLGIGAKEPERSRNEAAKAIAGGDDARRLTTRPTKR